MKIEISRALGTLQGMANEFFAMLPTLGIALMIFVLFYYAAKGLKSLVSRLTARRQRHRNLGLVLGRLSQWLTVFVGLLVALIVVFPSFKVGDVVQLLGIGGVAIGFAFRDILQNFLAGILLLITEPFRLNDQIIVGNFEGTVEEIQGIHLRRDTLEHKGFRLLKLESSGTGFPALSVTMVVFQLSRVKPIPAIQTRATLIQTYDGRRIVIPNANLFTGAVIVNTAFEKRRLEYDVGIGVGDDIAQAKTLMLEAIRSVDGVLQEPASEVLVVKLADFSVQLRARWWIKPPRRADALDMQDQVLTAMKTTLIAHGIDLPFPTQQILFHDQTEETDGDRSRQREGWPVGQGEVPQPHSLAGTLRKLAERGTYREVDDHQRNTHGGA